MNARNTYRPVLDRGWRLLLLTAFVVGLLAAPANTARAEETKIGLIFNTTDGEADLSFNYMAKLGMDQAVTDWGIDGNLYYPASATYSDYVIRLQQCVSDGNVLCFAVGYNMHEALYDVATSPSNAGVHFAILDYAFDTYPANVRGIAVDGKAAAYLAGALAASQFPGADLGVVAGTQIPTVQDLVDGFRNGAQCVGNGVDVWTNYTGAFGDNGSGVAAATDMINNGAAAIFTVAGPNGNSALLYATQYTGRDVYGIGVDADQYLNLFGNGTVDGSDHLLSSAIKGQDTAVYETIEDELASSFTSGTVTYGVGGGGGAAFEGGARLAPYHEVTVAAGVTTYVNNVDAGILGGSIDVDYPCMPRFHTEIVENDVLAIDWLAGIELTLTVDDPITGPNPDITRTAMADATGFARFQDLGTLQLTSGMYVTMSGNIPQAGGVVTKTHTIRDLTVTNVNTSLDTVSGTGHVGDQLSIQYCQDGCSWRRTVTVDGDGEWVADFGHPDAGGSTPEESNTLDIWVTTVGEALWGGPNGGITDVQWRGVEIGAHLNDNVIYGQG